MSRQPEFPTEITLETLPQLFAAHRARFGGITMEDGPQRPDDVSEEAWEALGEAGKQAIHREREKNADLTRNNARLTSELAAAKARPGPTGGTKTEPKPGEQPNPGSQGGDTEGLDIAAQIKAAVAEAVKPLQEAQQQATAAAAAQKVAEAVQTAAEQILHDKTDSMQIDLTTVVDTNGNADPQKIQEQLAALVKAKPHLAKTDGRRYPHDSSFGGAGGNSLPLGDQVKAQLAAMQAATNIRPASTN